MLYNLSGMISHIGRQMPKARIGQMAAGPTERFPRPSGSRMGEFNAKAQSRNGAARQAATNGLEQEQTEETEVTEKEKVCQKCAILGNSRARSFSLLCDFAVLSAKTLHFRQSSFPSVFSVSSCSAFLVAACRAAPLRLCVGFWMPVADSEMGIYRREHRDDKESRLRIGALRSLRSLRLSSFLLSAVPAVIGGFLPKAATDQLLPRSNLACKPAKFAYQSQSGQAQSNPVKPGQTRSNPVKAK